MKSLQLGLTMLLLASAANSHGLTLTAGINDAFGGGPEPASPSAALLSAYGQAVVGFDTFAQDTPLFHTFENLPANIVAATLAFRIRGTAIGSDTDGIALSFISNPLATYEDEVVYARNFGTFPGGGGVFQDPDAGLVTPGVPWAIGSEALVILDLANLPLALGGTVNLLPSINAAGFLDILLGDDSMIDFIALDVTAVPVPGAIWLISPLLALLYRRQRTW